jgi:hypothetical protein
VAQAHDIPPISSDALASFSREATTENSQAFQRLGGLRKTVQVAKRRLSQSEFTIHKSKFTTFEKASRA